MRRITLSIGELALLAELKDSPLADRLLGLLPIEVEMTRWGDEYYGTCGLATEEAPDMPDAREVMEIGEIAYWPSGDALCIFFGQTPVSTDHRPRAVSPVVPLGALAGVAESAAGGDESEKIIAALKSMGATVIAKLDSTSER